MASKQPNQKIVTGRHTPNEFKTQVSRSIGSGAGTKRGNRRDTHPSFSTGKVRKDGGRAGPLGQATRKGGPRNDTQPT
jgi:hypothetical protein